MAGRIAYYGNIVRDGLVLNLDAAKRDSYPGTGTVWRDIAGGVITGSLVNGPTFNTNNGGSITFDGVDDYVICTKSNITGNTPWSISIWINVDISKNGAGRQGWMVWRGGQSTSQLIAIGVTSGYVEVAHYANDTTFTNSPISFGTFQNITVTFNGTTELIYMNGTNTDNKSTSLSLTDGDWYFSSRVGASGFLKCNMSQFIVYNRALSATEVLQNYNATKGRFGL